MQAVREFGAHHKKRPSLVHGQDHTRFTSMSWLSLIKVKSMRSTEICQEIQTREGRGTTGVLCNLLICLASTNHASDRSVIFIIAEQHTNITQCFCSLHCQLYCHYNGNSFARNRMMQCSFAHYLIRDQPHSDTRHSPRIRKRHVSNVLNRRTVRAKRLLLTCQCRDTCHLNN